MNFRSHYESIVAKIFQKKEMAYRHTFKTDDEEINPMAATVLADLRTFCFATMDLFCHDSHEMARRAGRKEVFDRIMTFLKVDYQDYYKLTEQELFDE